MKDRIGVAMIDDAERKELLKPGGSIVERKDPISTSNLPENTTQWLLFGMGKRLVCSRRWT